MTPDPLIRPDLLQGMLDMLVLRTVADEALHGYAIAQRIRLVSGDRLAIPQGSLYPALRRLENQALLKGEWRTTATGRDARVYKLTAKGRRRLDAELREWSELTTAIGLILGTA
jgi:PadR family transcriptional regulator, regulatory protein PadR